MAVAAASLSLVLIIQILMNRGNNHSLGEWLSRHHHATKLLFVVVLLSSLACNAFAGNLQPFPTPPDLTRRAATSVPLPAMAATATLMGSGPGGQATLTMLVNLNIRSGPGVEYDRVGYLSEGSRVPVIGIDLQTGWLKIPCPEEVEWDECWVSGGPQYVSVENEAGMPTAVAPQLPTAMPESIAGGHSTLAYVDGSQLYVAGLDLNQSPAQLATEPKLIGSSSAVQQIAFSPDGRRLAVVAGDEQGANNLSVVNVDGGDWQTLVTSSILPLGESTEVGQQTAAIDKIQWLPDSAGIVFNTAVTGLAGPSAGSQEDLWAVSLDGELKNLFPKGQGGGEFLILQDGRLLLSRRGEIIAAHQNSLQQERLLEYELVETTAETTAYPPLRETSGGVYTSVPASDPLIPGARIDLWKLPPQRPASKVGFVTNVMPGHPLSWSSDGRRLAFVQPADASDQILELLIIAAGDGSAATPYAGGSDLSFLGWNDTNDQFLYSGNGYFAAGRLAAPQQQALLSTGQMVGDAAWLTESDYIITLDEPQTQQWELRSTNTNGESQVLLNGSGTPSVFELWIP